MLSQLMRDQAERNTLLAVITHQIWCSMQSSGLDKPCGTLLPLRGSVMVSAYGGVPEALLATHIMCLKCWHKLGPGMDTRITLAVKKKFPKLEIEIRLEVIDGRSWNDDGERVPLPPNSEATIPGGPGVEVV